MSFSITAINHSLDNNYSVRNTPSLTFVIPCYNEEAVLVTLLEGLNKLSAELLLTGYIVAPAKIILVDDGSTDKTWELICEATGNHEVMGVRLSRNHGHQLALLAGLSKADADVVVSMDADLQDDINAVPKMLEAYMRGAEIVYGVRASRSSDTLFKRLSARGYYRLLSILGADIVPDHADFRLMSRKALSTLCEFEERNLFLRGLVRKIGYVSETVEYDRAERAAGESKYPFSKMLALALEGVTSLSVMPLRIIFWVGLLISLLSFVFGCCFLLAWSQGKTVPGWTSIVVPIFFLGGTHLLALGVIGEYIGKIYLETKARPRFIVDEVKLPVVIQQEET